MKITKKYLRNYLTHPWQQIKYAFVCGMIFSVLYFVMNVLIYFRMETYSWHTSMDNNSIQYFMLALKEQLMSASIQVFIATFVVALVFIIFLTHRFVGPLVSISRFLRAHISGEQTAELKIRKNDELHEIVDLLNKLNQKDP